MKVDLTVVDQVGVDLAKVDLVCAPSLVPRLSPTKSLGTRLVRTPPDPSCTIALLTFLCAHTTRPATQEQ